MLCDKIKDAAGNCLHIRRRFSTFVHCCFHKDEFKVESHHKGGSKKMFLVFFEFQQANKYGPVATLLCKTQHSLTRISWIWVLESVKFKNPHSRRNQLAATQNFQALCRELICLAGCSCSSIASCFYFSLGCK